MLTALAKLGSRSILGRILRLPLRLIPRSQVLTVRRGINKGFRWVVGSSIHGCWLGIYEPEKQALISRIVRPGMVVWDVGANAGFYTLGLSRLVGESGKVYAFEPYAENANSLLTHVRLNTVRNARIVQVALAGSVGLIGFSISPSNSMGRVSKKERGYIVPSVTADDVLRQIPEARPDLLKIDVEGAESSILSSATRLLRDCAPVIVLALHGEDQSRQCAGILLAHGYSLYYLDGSPADSMPLRSDEIYACRHGASGLPPV